MDRVTVVIGAGFGDEGKGLMTDFFAHRGGAGTQVTRFSGGAQAGHTVVTPQGRRHVFHHIGAGTLAGASTFLSHHFTTNPILFQQELRDYYNGGGLQTPSVKIAHSCRVTLPWDMLINQMLETRRGGYRHGSCGVGVHETEYRYRHGIALPVGLLLDIPDWKQHCTRVVDDWYKVRCERADLVPPELDGLMEAFLLSVAVFLESVEIVEWKLWGANTHVFEGSQGLLLDREHKFFPYVTPSFTGLRNVLDLLKYEEDVRIIDVVYVLRPYLTRHGAGPFPSEAHGLGYQDSTNLPHPFQGSLRFGYMDFALVREAIDKDLLLARGSRFVVRPCLAITHVDQLGRSFNFVTPDGLDWAPSAELPTVFEKFLGLPVRYVSHGPTRNDVIER